VLTKLISNFIITKFINLFVYFTNINFLIFNLNLLILLNILINNINGFNIHVKLFQCQKNNNY